MGMCEDFPCCGHEMGCCPDYDDYGHQMNMVCTCGAKISTHSRYSLCESCMNAEEMPDGTYRHRTPEDVAELGGYGADRDWEVDYWRGRALKAEGALKSNEDEDEWT